MQNKYIEELQPRNYFCSSNELICLPKELPTVGAPRSSSIPPTHSIFISPLGASNKLLSRLQMAAQFPTARQTPPARCEKRRRYPIRVRSEMVYLMAKQGSTLGRRGSNGASRFHRLSLFLYRLCCRGHKIAFLIPSSLSLSLRGHCWRLLLNIYR